MTVVERGAHDIEIHQDMVEGCSFAQADLAKAAADVRHDGVVVFPTVRAATSEVIAGHIVIAACLELGRSVCRVNLIDCTDAEAAALREKHANMSGLDKDEEMLRTIQAFMEEEVGGTYGKSRGARAKALDRYSAVHGIPLETTKTRFKRAERRLRHKRFMLEDRYEECPIEDWGMTTDRDFRITLHHMVDRVRHMKSLCTQLSRVVEATQDDPHTKMPEARYKMLMKQVEKTQRLVHAVMPTSLCKACGGDDEGVRRLCLKCSGMGYITTAMED